MLTIGLFDPFEFGNGCKSKRLYWINPFLGNTDLDIFIVTIDLFLFLGFYLQETSWL